MSEPAAAGQTAAGQIAERVRRALLEAAAEAWEEAAVAGLCGDGAFEAAIGRMRSLDLGSLLDSASTAESPGRAPRHGD